MGGSWCGGLAVFPGIHGGRGGQGNTRHKCKDAAVAQFWVREAGSQGRMLFWGKRTKRKKAAV